MDKENRYSGGSDLPRPKKPIAPPQTSQSSTTPAAPAQQNRPAPRPVVQPVQKNQYDDSDRTRVMQRPTDRSDTQPIAPPPVQLPQKPQGTPPPVRQTAPRKSAPKNKQPAGTPKQKKSHRVKKKKSRLLRVFISLLTTVAILFGIYSFISLRCINSLTKAEPGARTASVSGCLDESYVRNILLIGSDSRDGTRGRSDTMILLSLNSKTDTLTLVSFLRDTYVTLADGHGENRLNAAYSLGGPELLMDTIQNNYKIRIDDYIEVNFLSFASIVDAVGGVEITITDAEAEAINNILRDEVNALAGDPVTADFLPKGGTYQLNGKQALSYSRIRKVGNADFERTERQREVITGIVTSLKDSGADGIRSLTDEALPNLITNMSTFSLYTLSLRAPFLLGYDIEQMQVPADGTWKGETIHGASVLTVDLDENRRLLEDTLYADEP
ncbi:MAG: hypothetical protein E7501_06215 [Ruminococcus sp.]|nr:hypothetical protein [Ruminococcus sp.]